VRVIPAKLPGVLIIEPKVFDDDRGYFLESFHASRYAEYGIPGPFVQDNHSHSVKDVLRGLHYQLEHPQGKLVSVCSGKVFDVAVDIRTGSPTFGQWEGLVLSEKNHRQLYIPPGFAHGFCVLSEKADFQYKCTNYYHPEDEGGILWSDSDIRITWPCRNPVLSNKDQGYQQLRDIPVDRLPKY